ncbi:hypothetical protein [Xanthomonas sp. CFBP 8445]|uniref:hypothetical protein n=1 Tax=Xanthomonas sp. CFBP 8445 TaxID=2971236 RepID=UPI0021E02D9C|nr:hypothetical protein [Xanthomonas sp. CFBP 8445]UYC12106.1 hypothetical protein NUG21_20605 [Xanthomonas sp. CFBP 8445]
MISPVSAFFWGASPGICLILVNMLIHASRVRVVRKMAIAEGQDWDFKNEPLTQFKILIKNEILFVDGESGELRDAKIRLLEYDKKYFVVHYFGAFLIMAGGFLGAFFTLL